MLTINYNGKTYKITGDNSEIEGVIRTAINNGVLDCIKCGEHAPCEYAETKEEPLIKDTIHNDCSGGLPSNDWCVERCVNF